jgi:bacterioferritin-associated ferredoxin
VYVCHCRVVTDREVERAIADGARTIEEIGARCGAGTDCASCHPELERLLSERHLRLAGAGLSHGR